MAKHWRQLRAELLDRSQKPPLERYVDQSWRPKAPNTQGPIGVGLTVQCPWCQAKAGEPCVSFRGTPSTTHVLRQMAENHEPFVAPGSRGKEYDLHVHFYDRWLRWKRYGAPPPAVKHTAYKPSDQQERLAARRARAFAGGRE